MFHFALTRSILFGILAGVSGCSWINNSQLQSTFPFVGSPQIIENPMFVPVTDRELVWNQVVDELDGYFKIRSEERIRLVGDVLTEGRIETYPRPGSTLLEPHRRDSTPGFEKLHSTLQSVRRQATVRVIPATGGHEIIVEVFKELEDLPRPEHSTVGGALLRHDNSLERYEAEEYLNEKPRFGTDRLTWIPLGRDLSLEQQILGNIYARLYSGGGPITPLPKLPVDVHVQER